MNKKKTGLKRGSEYRKTAKERNKKWRETLLEEGYKPFNVMLPPDAQKVIQEQKRRYPRLTNQQIIEKALAALQQVEEMIPDPRPIDPVADFRRSLKGLKRTDDGIPSASINDIRQGEAEPPQAAPPKKTARKTAQEMEATDNFLLKLFGEKMKSAEIAETLNQQGHTTASYKKWTGKMISQAITRDIPNREKARNQE